MKDTYALAAVDRHLASTWPALTPHRAAVLALGQHATDRGDAFNTAVLGARTCGAVRVDEQALHLLSWISRDLGALLDVHLGSDWHDKVTDEAAWKSLLDLSDDAVWTLRQRLRGYLIDFMRERARRRWAREQISGARIVALGTLLDDAALTIGCVPRFGDGDGAELLFEDVDRLARIATAARRPVQFIFAGRAGRTDDLGRHHLQRTFRQILDSTFGGRLAFVEDYDLHVAHLMVQGCDAWLTMPSSEGGESLGAGKAAVNGVPHIGPSYAPSARWSFDDSQTLYRLLEDEVVPAFYERDRAGVPGRWTSIVRAVLAASIPRYTARRALIAAAGHSSFTRV